MNRQSSLRIKTARRSDSRVMSLGECVSKGLSNDGFGLGLLTVPGHTHLCQIDQRRGVNFERERFLCLRQHLICMFYGSLEDLSNIKSKYGKRSLVQVMLIYTINLGTRRQSF